MNWFRPVLVILARLAYVSPGLAQSNEPAPPPPSFEEVPVDAPRAGVAPPATPTREIPPPPPPDLVAYAPAPPDAVLVGAERHDGFYFRMALGFSALRMDRSTSGSLYGGLRDSYVSGVGGATELSIGGTPSPGLVLAGTLLVHQIAEPALKFDGGGEMDLGGPFVFVVFGGSVDWYPNPRGGFHFGGTLGLAGAVANAPEDSGFDNIGGGGAALSLQLGYDWWVADQWSVGILGRFTSARVHGEATADVSGVELKGEEDSSVSALAVMFSVLYH